MRTFTGKCPVIVGSEPPRGFTILGAPYIRGASGILDVVSPGGEWQVNGNGAKSLGEIKCLTR